MKIIMISNTGDHLRDWHLLDIFAVRSANIIPISAELILKSVKSYESSNGVAQERGVFD